MPGIDVPKNGTIAGRIPRSASPATMKVTSSGPGTLVGSIARWASSRRMTSLIAMVLPDKPTAILGPGVFISSV